MRLSRFTFMLLWAGVVGGCALLQPSFNPHVPPPVKSVDLRSYLGRWYEQARYDSSFERGCEASVAEYAVLPGGLISVVNSCHAGTPEGRLRVARGRARVVAGSGNARLLVSFFGPFFVGRYWVLDHDDAYRWTIVGEPSGGYLWILTRDAHPDAKLLAELVRRAAAMGYDTTHLRFVRQPAAQ